MRILTDFAFLLIFFVLFATWAFAWLAFHVVSGGIHVLLGLAVVFLIVHLMKGSAAA
jgi:hypothetical protein